MRIEIAERLRPFSHRPGTYVLLPGTPWRLCIYPTLIRIDDLSESDPKSLGALSFEIEGPLDEFTILQDMQKGIIKVWGKSKEGFFRYAILAFADYSGLRVSVEKVPEKGLTCYGDGFWNFDKRKTIHNAEVLVFKVNQVLSEDLPFQMPDLDQLSLGCHRAQEWDLIRRREAFSEIFPFWHRLGQIIPTVVCENSQPISIIDRCQESINGGHPEKILPQFRKLFLGGFDDLLSPRMFDRDFQGIEEFDEAANQLSTPLTLLVEGTRLIRSLFLQDAEDCLNLLPALPPEFHCGRYINIKCGNKGILSFEWTKKSLRRASFISSRSQNLGFKFSKGGQECRLRNSHLDRGRKYHSATIIELVAGQNYWFDNFIR